MQLSSFFREDPMWRRGSTGLAAAVYVFLLLCIGGVYYYSQMEDGVRLPLSTALGLLESHCPARELEKYAEALDSPSPPPSVYGLTVWLDDERLVPAVRATAATINRRLVRARQEVRAELQGRGTAGSGHGDAAAAAELVLHIWLQKKTTEKLVANAATNSTITTDTLNAAADVQQLGLPTFRHVFKPDSSKEFWLEAVSFFSLPASLLPVDQAQVPPVYCSRMRATQTYCVLPTTAATDPSSGGSAYVAANVSRQVEAALASVLAAGIGARSFTHDDLVAWERQRQLLGCHYAARSLRILDDIFTEHPHVVAPTGSASLYHQMVQLISMERDYVRAARAADDIQFHPLLTPQLFLPTDQSFVSHVVLLMPMLLTAVLGIRVMRDDQLAVKVAALSKLENSKALIRKEKIKDMLRKGVFVAIMLGGFGVFYISNLEDEEN